MAIQVLSRPSVVPACARLLNMNPNSKQFIHDTVATWQRRVEATRNGKTAPEQWSLRKGTVAEPGEQGFLLRLVVPPKGIFGACLTTSHHYVPYTDGVSWVKIEWYALSNPLAGAPLIPLDELQDKFPGVHGRLNHAGTRSPRT